MTVLLQATAGLYCCHVAHVCPAHQQIDLLIIFRLNVLRQLVYGCCTACVQAQHSHVRSILAELGCCCLACNTNQMLYVKMISTSHTYACECMRCCGRGNTWQVPIHRTCLQVPASEDHWLFALYELLANFQTDTTVTARDQRIQVVVGHAAATAAGGDGQSHRNKGNAGF